MTEQQRKPVVFIAGPMTGYQDYNRAEFDAEASVLSDRGFTVLNPAILPDGLEHQQYLAITLAMLEQGELLEGKVRPDRPAAGALDLTEIQRSRFTFC